jgi:hypothetical protein
MTTIEGLDSVIEIYLRSSTMRYVEAGEYTSPSQMIGESEYDNITDFIKYDLIIKIAHSWEENIYDIGKWRYDPMFRHMFSIIVGNPILMTHMINTIHTARRTSELSEELPEYSPVTVMRHYAYHYALKLESSFFERYIEEECNRPRDDEIPDRRDPDASDSDGDDTYDSEDDDDAPYCCANCLANESKPTRIPPPA